MKKIVSLCRHIEIQGRTEEFPMFQNLVFHLPENDHLHLLDLVLHSTTPNLAYVESVSIGARPFEAFRLKNLGVFSEIDIDAPRLLGAYLSTGREEIRSVFAPLIVRIGNLSVIPQMVTGLLFGARSDGEVWGKPSWL